MECEFGDANCVPDSQHPCFKHKARYWRTEGTPMVHVPAYFKQDVSQTELARQNFEGAKADGRELERVR